MLKYEQRKQKPPQRSIYSLTYGQCRKHPQSSAPLEKTPREEAAEVEEVEAETPLLPQEAPLRAQDMEVAGEEIIDSLDNPRMYSQETAPR